MRSRAPRNYQGTEILTKKMTDLLPEFLDELRRKKGDEKEVVFEFWQSLVGEKMAALTEPVSLIEGVLTVKVKSSTLYSLLVTHERPRLLAQLKEKFSVRNLVFRIG